MPHSSLVNLELNFICADSLVDIELEKQVAYLGEYSQHAMGQLWQLTEDYISNPSDHRPLEEALTIRAKLRENLAEHFQQTTLPEPPAFLALMFFPCYFEPSGKPRSNGGFDGIIGNPPWEGFKPIKKEFAYRFSGGKPELRKYGMDATEFEKWFNEQMRNNESFQNAWHQYEESYAQYKEFLSRSYQYQGTGDWNLYKLFVEANLRLVREQGRLSMLVQSGFSTDEGTGPLRKILLFNNLFLESTSFENKGYIERVEGTAGRKKIFPDVHPQFKFGFFKVLKGPIPPADHAFDARSYIHDPKEVFAAPIRYSLDMVRYFSPDNCGIMEFRTERDVEVCTKLRSDHALLGSLGYRFRREFHLTDDRRFLNKTTAKLKTGEMPLFEGKTIFQFDAHFKPSTLHVLENEARPELLRKEVYRLSKVVRTQKVTELEGEKVPEKKAQLDALLVGIFERKGFKLHYEFPRVAYREVGSSTNERSLIAALIPPRSCMSHKLMYLTPCRYDIDSKGNVSQLEIPETETVALLAILNSLTINYYARNKVSTGVSVFQLNELPIPPLDAKQRKQLAASAAKLSKKSDDLQERAWLEFFIARDLYGLSLDDWRHLGSSFIYGGDSDSKADLDEIIRLSTKDWAEA